MTSPQRDSNWRRLRFSLRQSSYYQNETQLPKLSIMRNKIKIQYIALVDDSIITMHNYHTIKYYMKHVGVLYTKAEHKIVRIQVISRLNQTYSQIRSWKVTFRIKIALLGEWGVSLSPVPPLCPLFQNFQWMENTLLRKRRNVRSLHG